MTLAVELGLAAVLVLSAILKLRHFKRSASALGVYGLRDARLRRGALGALVAAEIGVAAVLLARPTWALWAAAGLFGAFALATSAALLAGRGGLPCACFGSSSRLSWRSPLRVGLLAGVSVAAAGGWLPAAPSGYDSWLTVGLAVALTALAGLATVVLALAREIAVLKLSLVGHGALEILDEGPALGEPQAWASAVPSSPRARVRLAVFSSEGCPLCRRLEPALAYVGEDPLVSLRVFDEVADASVWAAARAPGSPFAVALGELGTVLAKGTFNNLAQLESILATAREREQEPAFAA